MVERKESLFNGSIPLVTIPAKQIAFIDQLVRLRKLKATTLIIILLSATACQTTGHYDPRNSITSSDQACKTHAGKYSKNDGTTPESFTTADMMLMLCKQCVRDGGTDCY